MKRMKTFFIYLILFLLLYLFVSIMSYLVVKTAYKNINSYEIASESPKVTIKESKATSVNGYIIGTVKNDTGEYIEKTNLKVDFYSPRGVNLGTKVVKIEDFKEDEVKEFRINYEFSNVKSYIVDVTTDEVTEHESGDIFNTKAKMYWLLGGLAALVMLVFP